MCRAHIYAVKCVIQFHWGLLGNWSVSVIEKWKSWGEREGERDRTKAKFNPKPSRTKWY